MLLARVPVPWGSEPKAQTVYGLTKGTSWYNPSHKPIPVRDFESDVDIDVVYKTLVSTPSSRPPQQEIPLVLVKWAVLRGMLKSAAPPNQSKLQVMAFPKSQTSWVEQVPSSLLDWATNKGIERSQKPEKLIPLDPFLTRTKVFSLEEDTQEWVSQLPPSLLAWAVDRGVKKHPVEKLAAQDPFTAKSNVVSLEERLQIAATAMQRGEWHKIPPSLVRWAIKRGIGLAPEVHALQGRRQVFEALERGEWCLVSELDFLPPRLRQWLIECKVRFIRYVGGGQIGRTPVNGYVTEDGVVFYVAEDSLTFYVQET